MRDSSRWALVSLLALGGALLCGLVAVYDVSGDISRESGYGISVSEVFAALTPIVVHSGIVGLTTFAFLCLIVRRSVARRGGWLALILILAPTAVALAFGVFTLEAVGGLDAFRPRSGG